MTNNYQKYLIIFLLLLIFLFSIPVCYASETDADKQFNFAAHYFSEEEYVKAIREYERFIYLFPKDSRVKTAMYAAGMSYFKQNRFNEAITAFGKIIGKYGDSNFSLTDIAQAYFMISECHVNMNTFESAVSVLRNLLSITDDRDISDEAMYRMGWIYLEMGMWDKAHSYFEKISSENKNKYNLKKLTAELDKEISIPAKNPVIAGMLSVVPGGGFLYCERYYDAMTAFLLNGLMIYAAYESFDKEMYALGSLISLVELGFYTGNIYGSISSANKYNKNQYKNFFEQLKRNTRLGLSGYKHNGVLCFLQVDFE